MFVGFSFCNPVPIVLQNRMEKWAAEWTNLDRVMKSPTEELSSFS